MGLSFEDKMDIKSSNLDSLAKEIEEEKQASSLALRRWQFLSKKHLKISDAELAETYKRFSLYLNLRFPKALERTQSEIQVREIIKSCIRMPVRQSLWIGSVNCDLFFPQFGGCGRNGMTGLAVEVDGPIHDREAKMIKDESKYDLLRAIGIGVFPITNENVKDPHVRCLLHEFKELPRLDSRGRRRLWRKIYLITICANYNEGEFKAFLKRCLKNPRNEALYEI